MPCRALRTLRWQRQGKHAPKTVGATHPDLELPDQLRSRPAAQPIHLPLLQSRRELDEASAHGSTWCVEELSIPSKASGEMLVSKNLQERRQREAALKAAWQRRRDREEQLKDKFAKIKFAEYWQSRLRDDVAEHLRALDTKRQPPKDDPAKFRGLNAFNSTAENFSKIKAAVVLATRPDELQGIRAALSSGKVPDWIARGPTLPEAVESSEREDAAARMAQFALEAGIGPRCQQAAVRQTHQPRLTQCGSLRSLTTTAATMAAENLSERDAVSSSVTEKAVATGQLVDKELRVFTFRDRLTASAEEEEKKCPRFLPELRETRARTLPRRSRGDMGPLEADFMNRSGVVTRTMRACGEANRDISQSLPQLEMSVRPRRAQLSVAV